MWYSAIISKLNPWGKLIERKILKHLFLFYLLTFFLFAEQKYTNALIKEDSPYLQQHAHNPVNWYPWGKEAFEKAKKENKLIFLSIGYSTCHWCHVMEEESFVNEDVARLLNRDYISIKVDREAYPQLDKKYQQLFMSVYGKRGGWPLTVFMSPEGEAFHLETYIPVEEAYGLDGMLKMLPAYANLYRKNTEKFNALTAEYRKRIREGNTKQELKRKPTMALIDNFMEAVSKEFDPANGGFAKRPKFPEASKLVLLLDIYKLTGNQKAFHMAELTLEKMATQGIYDQIGGGFFRYTTDEAWQIPHFEKMLYTNAELIPVYVTMYQLTQKPLYKRVVAETIAEMETHFMKEDVYFSASDADSEGEEGAYFIFDYVEVKEALLKQGIPEKEVEEALAYLGIEEDGNIDGELSLPHITSEKVPARLPEVRNYLHDVMKRRAFPFVDRKVNTAWNAMMIKALFSASVIDTRYQMLAEKHLNSLLKMMSKKGVLYHQTLLGKNPVQKALLEDYAFLMDAVIAGYETNYDERYLAYLKVLVKESLKKFNRDGVWYLSHDNIAAVADFDDRYYTSALSMLLEDYVRLASLNEDLDLMDVVKKTVKAEGAVLETAPQSASKLLHVFLRMHKGDVIIKSEADNLLKVAKIIEAIRYPFVLTKAEAEKIYLACRVNSCFAYDKEMTKLIEKINKAVK